MRRAHLSKYFIQPLKGTMKMYLYPAWSACYILAMIFSSPTLYKTHTEGAHLRKLIHCLKAMVYRLSQKLSKLLIIENLQTAATGDFADGCGMEPVMVVAVPALHKNTAVAKTFCIHFPTNIIEMNTFANMPPCILNGGVAVNIREQPQAKSVLVVGRISEAIHQDTGGRSMERLPNTIIQLIVDNGAPMLRLFISNCLNISSVYVGGNCRCHHVGIHWLGGIVCHLIFRRQVSRRWCISWHLEGTSRV